MKKLETGLREKQFSWAIESLCTRILLNVLMPCLQALDSDGEGTPREATGSKAKKASDEEKASGSNKPAISEASSDGELVEIPDQESDTAHKKATGATE